ncbi:MAG: M50 family metallopeptidase [Pirellulales bacterium]|nr:M50 family metallopeptidase [Pirellulales bacterium]
MAVHELGHVLAGWLTGGTVTKVVLHPLAISRTDVSPNPNPIIVVWAGPLLGVLLPLLIWLVCFLARIPGAYLPRFFAGFCLIANGAYIGVGSIDGIGDAGEMVRHGTPIWGLWVFGVLVAPIGLLLWHRLGQHFGLGESRGRVDVWAAYLSLSLLLLTLIVMFAVSPRS